MKRNSYVEYIDNVLDMVMPKKVFRYYHRVNFVTNISELRFSSSSESEIFNAVCSAIVDINPAHGDFWVNRSVYFFKSIFNALIFKCKHSNEKLSYLIISESLTLAGCKNILSSLESISTDEYHKFKFILDGIPGSYQSNMKDSQFDYLVYVIKASLHPILFHIDHVLKSIPLRINGAKRLGGEDRMIKDIEELFLALDQRPGCRRQVIDILFESNIEKSFIAPFLSDEDKGRVLGNLLGV